MLIDDWRTPKVTEKQAVEIIRDKIVTEGDCNFREAIADGLVSAGIRFKQPSEGEK